MSQPSVISVVSKPGREEAINALYRAELGEDFLIWTRKHIAQRIRAVNAGQFESLSHLKGKLASIDDWNRAMPEMSEGRGTILIADHEATLTPVQLLALRRYVLFLQKHKDQFVSIEGLDVAEMLLGGAGRRGIGVVAPEMPKNDVYLLCVRYKVLDLWTLYYKFTNGPSKDTWSALKKQIVPWCLNQTVEALVKRVPGNSTRDDFPNSLILRRAMLPTNLNDEARATLSRGVFQFPPKDRR